MDSSGATNGSSIELTSIASRIQALLITDWLVVLTPTEGVTPRVAGGFPEAGQCLVGSVSSALSRLKREGGY